MSWQDWLQVLLSTAELSRTLPTRLNTHQSRVLWERCLRREVSSPLLNIAALVRQARDAWTRLHDFSVPLDQVDRTAQGRDQRIFASAANGYQSILMRENWIDDAGLTGVAAQLVISGDITLSAKITLAGFDRLTPAAAKLLAAVRDAGTKTVDVEIETSDRPGRLVAFENSDAEIRAAGAWAREELINNSSQVVAIVASHLDKDANRCARLVRECLVPGWQTSDRKYTAAVNVSYGRRLSSYPAIATALLALRWLRDDIDSRDVSFLLRSAALGQGQFGGRSRLELELRRQPLMNWSPQMILSAFAARGEHQDGADFLSRIKILNERREGLPARESPSAWATLIDETLKQLNWPGEAVLDSVEFQLINRWRELLNDLARLQLVVPSMTLGETLGRLQTLAAETVFQPESKGALVHLLGPLEAAGLQFDRLWVSGLSAANWPPAGRPSPLISRQLQRDYSMPDADPGDTLAYAGRVLRRLADSTQELVCSFPSTEGDAEQSASGLVTSLVAAADEVGADPGWYAKQLSMCASPLPVTADPVPPVTIEESVSGGAATIQRQLTEPFSAFAYGRLGVRPVPAITNGLPANIRGSLIHDALFRLYRDLPSRSDIADLNSSDIDERLPGILKQVFARMESSADPVLRQLLNLEKQRVAMLLRQVIALDTSRDDFVIQQLEAPIELAIDQVRLRLRIDRIDRLENGEVVVIDYKSGRRRQVLNSSREPDDMQLVAYAFGLDDPVAGLAFVNVDSRQVDLSGAGRFFTPDLDWDSDLSRWKNEIRGAVLDLQKGDVRLNNALPIKTGRFFGLLSRIRELQHER
jgi:probable DNA repair protein